MNGKRQRLLQGMLIAVGTKGYEQTSVQDAVALAGVYRQAFYDSFTSKEDCYLQALDLGTGWVEAQMREGAATAVGWRDRLRGALDALLRFLDDQPAVGRALVVEVHAAGPEAVRRRTETMERAAALLDSAREEGDEAAPPISSEAVVAGILAVLHTRLTSSATTSFLPLLPELMYLAVLPYFGADAAAAELLAG